MKKLKRSSGDTCLCSWSCHETPGLMGWCQSMPRPWTSSCSFCLAVVHPPSSDARSIGSSTLPCPTRNQRGRVCQVHHPPSGVMSIIMNSLCSRLWSHWPSSWTACRWHLMRPWLWRPWGSVRWLLGQGGSVGQSSWRVGWRGTFWEFLCPQWLKGRCWVSWRQVSETDLYVRNWDEILTTQSSAFRLVVQCPSFALLEYHQYSFLHWDWWFLLTKFLDVPDTFCRWGGPSMGLGLDLLFSVGFLTRYGQASDGGIDFG